MFSDISLLMSLSLDWYIVVVDGGDVARLFWCCCCRR